MCSSAPPDDRLCGYRGCTLGPDGSRGTLAGRIAKTLFCSEPCGREERRLEALEGSDPDSFWGGLIHAARRSRGPNRIGSMLRREPRRPDQRMWA